MPQRNFVKSLRRSGHSGGDKPGLALGDTADALQAQRARSSKQHFEALDGLRGVAAIAVMLFHTYKGGGIIPNGPLAVDLFFLLSGFVIGYSYDQRLHSGMSRVEFAKRRIIRLYPMLLVGAIGGIILAIVHNITNRNEAYPLHSLLMSGALSLLTLPYLVPGALGVAIFSFNPPIWSLFFELLANVAYVAFFRRLPVWVLATIVIASMICIGFLGPLGGGAKDNFIGGFPRVGAGFFGGLMLYKLWFRRLLPEFSVNFLILSTSFLAIMICPWVIGGWFYVPIYGLFILVICAAVAAQPSKYDGMLALLGQISYPLYLTHWLTLYAFTFVGVKMHLTGDRYALVAAAHFFAAPFIAYTVSRLYERPVLDALRARFQNATPHLQTRAEDASKPHPPFAPTRPGRQNWLHTKAGIWRKLNPRGDRGEGPPRRCRLCYEVRRDVGAVEEDLCQNCSNRAW